MKKIHNQLKGSILQFIDFFYPLFKKVMPLQTFRYAACGGGNTALDICLFSINYNLIFRKQNVAIGSIILSPHIASFIFSFLITFPVGFYLSRYVVFQASALRRRTQLSRYFQVVLVCILLNYIFIKFFVEYMHWYPTPSKIITTCFVIAFSYLSQTYYSFRATKIKPQKATEVLTP